MIGSKKLPELSRSLGQALSEFKKRVGRSSRKIRAVRAGNLTAAGRGDAKPRREVNQLGHRAGVHLRHHVPALLLDGGFAGPELAGDLLVEEPGGDPGQHIAFTWSE